MSLMVIRLWFYWVCGKLFLFYWYYLIQGQNQKWILRHPWYGFSQLWFLLIYSHCWQFHLPRKQDPNVLKALLVWSMHVCLVNLREKVLPLDALNSSQYWVWAEKLDLCAETCETRSRSDWLVTNFYCAIENCDLSRCYGTGGCNRGDGLSQDKIKNAWFAKNGSVSEAKHKFRIWKIYDENVLEANLSIFK